MEEPLAPKLTPSQKQSDFPNTRKTWLLQVRSTDEKESAAAMENICKAYWKPMYATIRRKWRDMSQHDAEDAAQAFWEFLLEKQVLRTREPRGQFRALLMHCFDHFQSNQWNARRAQKRGGKHQHISRDDTDVWTEDCEAQMGTAAAPDEELERLWMNAAIEAAFGEVEAEWVANGRGPIFRELKQYIMQGAERGSYALIAAELGITEKKVREHYAFQLRKDLQAARERWNNGAT